MEGTTRKPRHSQEDSIRTDICKIWCNCVDWI